MNGLFIKLIVGMIFIGLVNALTYAETRKVNQTEKTVIRDKAQSSEIKKSKKSTKQPAEFIPTEKIKSDSFVSFPVDI
jgi:hypothetical protein